MAGLRFAWDLRKDAENQRKHGLSFDEALTVFADEHAILLDDPDHSTAEDRFVLVAGIEVVTGSGPQIAHLVAGSTRASRSSVSWPPMLLPNA